MDAELAKQILDEILPYLEDLDTRNAAILQLLKDKGLTTEEQFAPYVAEAGKTSNVKWLAARVRIGHLLSSIARDAEKAAKPAPDDGSKDPEKPAAENSKEQKLEVKGNTPARVKQTPPANKKGTDQQEQDDTVGEPATNPNVEGTSAKGAASNEKSNRDAETSDTSKQKAS